MHKFFGLSLHHSLNSLLVSAATTSMPFLVFSLPDSRSVLATLSFFPSFFYLSNLSGRSGRNCFLSALVLSGYNRTSDICFSRGTTWLKNWPNGYSYSCPLQSLAVSFLLSLVSILVFSRTEVHCLI